MKKLFLLLALLTGSFSKTEEPTTLLPIQQANILIRKSRELRENKDLTGAIGILQKAATLVPRATSIYINLGQLYRENMMLEESKNAYERALLLNPGNHDIELKLGYAYLILGKLKEGWHLFQSPEDRTKQLDPCGKNFLLKDEGGFGDLFHYLRWAKCLKERGATIILECRKSAIPLLSQCPYIDKVIAKDSPYSEYDYCKYIGHLQYKFSPTVETIPNEVPYLYPDPALTHEWHTRLSIDKKFKIGICWQSQRYYDKATQNMITDGRSQDLSNFYPLARLKNVSVYSLQKGFGEEQLKSIPSDITIHSFDATFDKSHGSFMDTAAVMKNLDLVITVDTAIAHLAGALGVPTWNLLCFSADWRWFANRSDSPLYPTMRLFRQPKPGDWDSVMQEVVSALKDLLEKQTNLSNLCDAMLETE